MGEHPDKDLIFVTISMAEILLAQNLVSETEKVVRQLQKSDPNNPRVAALAERLATIIAGPPPEQIPGEAEDEDSMVLECHEDALGLAWEVTPEGIEIARRRTRYSGHPTVRLFTAAPGPRGVRTQTRDFVIEHPAGTMALRGLPRPAVHAAAAGYLANTGMFVPLARSEPCVVPR